jgi:protein arginine kinase
MISEMYEAVERGGAVFSRLNIEATDAAEARSLLERHIISPEFFKSKNKKGLLLYENESAGVMLNEEDHIRIQAVCPGESMDDAWSLADKIDNLIEEQQEYAFDKDFGYLTSCPTNTGTGLRASYMVHLPALEISGQLKNIIPAIAKFGMTVRGIYGEGSDSLGCVYQISNQVTIGQSEHDIINALKNVTRQVIEREKTQAKKMFSEKNSEAEDRVYRAYGIASQARRMNSKEAMQLLSDIRMGFVNDICKLPKPRLTIYNLMMNIQPGTLQKLCGKAFSGHERDAARAEYLRSNF